MCGNVRVSHELLLHAHGRSGFVQPRTVRVAERVESDSSKSQLQTRRYQIVGTNRIGVQGSASRRTGKEPLSLGLET